VVPDASVLLKWVLTSDSEPDADKALILRTAILEGSVIVLLPSLWLYEVGNTIARRFPAEAAPWLTALVKFGSEEAPWSAPWLAKTLELALKLTRGYEVSFYDASYYALALIHHGTFVTADTRYVERTKELGAVAALRDWLPPKNGGRGRSTVT
jgi:predicted nucleic acid-binding protein